MVSLEEKMRILAILLASVWLSACATMGGKQSCPTEDLRAVSYFAEGQKLVAFQFQAAARGYTMNGVLQVKEVAEDAYDVTAVAATGGVWLIKAQVTREKINFTYVLPMADHALVRGKLETFLNMLLFAPKEKEKCREENGLLTVTVPEGVYKYQAGAVYPHSFVRKKTWGSVQLSYGEYTPYEKGDLPHYLFYEDGGIEAELVLITVKK